jgi:hypothetical protein
MKIDMLISSYSNIINESVFISYIINALNKECTLEVIICTLRIPVVINSPDVYTV